MAEANGEGHYICAPTSKKHETRGACIYYETPRRQYYVEKKENQTAATKDPQIQQHGWIS